jgi:sporulation protein YlmC with PRC-barrel domain
MRGIDLIGCAVHDADGTYLGVVHDLRFAADRQPGGPWRIRLTGLLCGKRRSLGHRFGYGQGDMAGPWPLDVVMRWRSNRRLEIDWDDVGEIHPHRITLRVRRDDSGGGR